MIRVKQPALAGIGDACSRSKKVAPIEDEQTREFDELERELLESVAVEEYSAAGTAEPAAIRTGEPI